MLASVWVGELLEFFRIQPLTLVLVQPPVHPLLDFVRSKANRDEPKATEVTVPKYWSYHGYRDIIKTGSAKHSDRFDDVARVGTDHGKGNFDYSKGVDLLTQESDLEKPKIFMTEGGINLKGAVNGNDSNTRLLYVPLAVNRLYYLVKAGQPHNKPYSDADDEAKYFSRIVGVTLYQMAKGDGAPFNEPAKFDSSLFESPLQTCQTREQNGYHPPSATIPPCDPQPAPRLRPVYCALRKFNRKESMKQCTGDNRPTNTLTAKSSGKSSVNKTSITSGGWNHEAEVEITMPELQVPEGLELSVEVKLELCTQPRGLGTESERECSTPDFCITAGCLVNQLSVGNPLLVSERKFEVEGDEEYESVVPPTFDLKVPLGYEGYSCGGGFQYDLTPIFTIHSKYADGYDSGDFEGDEDAEEGEPVLVLRGDADSGLYADAYCS